MSGDASYPNDCSTMLMIETKGGDKYDDEGLIRCSNYKNMRPLDCMSKGALRQLIIRSNLMKGSNKMEMKMLLVPTFSN